MIAFFGFMMVDLFKARSQRSTFAHTGVHKDRLMTNENEVEDYADNYDKAFRVQPRMRSLISRGSKPVRVDYFDEISGSWRSEIKMSQTKFDDKAKEVFLIELAKWGRMGEAAAAAGVTSGTVRRHMKEDQEFAEAMMVQEEEYKEKLIGHHQDLLFNGVEKSIYDKTGAVISTERVYPIKLIEMELKKHDEGYREKRELKVDVTGGVLVAPAEMETIGDWEERFGKAKDITPPKPEPDLIDHQEGD